MKTLLISFILVLLSTHVNAKSLYSFKTASNKKCSGSFPDRKYQNTFEDSIKLYYLYSCFPLESIRNVHPAQQKWLFPELVKIPVKKNLNLQERLDIVLALDPYLKRKSEKEKSLLNIISLKKAFGIPVKQEMTKLFNNYPSHNLNNESEKAAKDYNRRGQNKKALQILKKLLKKEWRRSKKISLYREIVKTQKNIKRDSDYLRYSQELTDLIYRQFRKKRSHKNRQIYLTSGLQNIRRIWTYSSTQIALDKLNALIKYHCKRGFDCSEHFWIKGRILEEKLRYSDALYWFSRAVTSTKRSHSEYQNRLWNLAWLTYKHKGAEQAKKVTLKHIKKIKEKDVGSKIYFWLSKWDPKESAKYEKLIRLHHPLSFYLWGKLALNQKIKIKTYSNKQIKKIAKKNYEKNLYTLYDLQENSLARAYVKQVETNKRTYGFKKNISWKKLKALTGLYADLLLDLEAKNIKPEESLFFFFSRGYEAEVTAATKAFGIEKNLLWSIIRQESNFDTYARSWADAFGLTQVLATRAHDYYKAVEKVDKKVNPFNLYQPELNTRVGAWLIKENLVFFNGELPLTIAAYNASRKKVNEWRERFYKNGDWLTLIEEITYRETRKYVKLVSRNLEVYKELEKNK